MSKVVTAPAMDFPPVPSISRVDLKSEQSGSSTGDGFPAGAILVKGYFEKISKWQRYRAVGFLTDTGRCDGFKNDQRCTGT